MTTDRLDAALDRLEALLDDLEDEERRHDVREIQQLVLGVKSDLEDGADED